MPKPRIYLVILAILVVVLAVYGKNLFSVTFDDSFVYNAGFDWQTSANWDIATKGTANSIIDASTGDWLWNVGRGNTVSLTSRKNFDSADATIVFSNNNDLIAVARNTLCSQNGAHIQIGSCGIDVNGGTTGAIYAPRDTVVQIINSRLDNTNFEVWVDGQKKCDGTGDRHVQISTSSSGFANECAQTLRMKSARYRPLFGCSINAGESLAMETFVAGSNIDINKFRYPVKRFCLAHPVIITDELKQGSDASAQPYDTLTRADSTGKPNSITIPQGQTYSFFYVFNYREAGISVACSQDQAYNANTQQCANAKGIINFCSQGQYDSARNACVVFPEIKQVCNQGTLTNGVCVYNPPVQATCKLGSYNSASQKCQFVPSNPPSCNDADYVWNSATSVCEAFPISVINQSCSDIGGVSAVVNGVERCTISPQPSVQCSAGFNAQQVAGKWSCVGIPQPNAITPQAQTMNVVGTSFFDNIVAIFNSVLHFFGIK